MVSDRDFQIPEAVPRRQGDKGLDQRREDDKARQREFDSVLDSFRRLVQAAVDTGRDWKLVDALLRTMIELVVETQGDVFTSVQGQPPAAGTTVDAAVLSAEASAEPRLRLRPEYRLRFQAIVDSWSDDETADFLGIGRRQVRRRAQQGGLYYFLVNRKRRYPVWQFDSLCGVVGGVADVGQMLPDSWPAECVYSFMTTRNPVLKLLTPAQWLLMKRDAGSIVAAIAKASPT